MCNMQIVIQQAAILCTNTFLRTVLSPIYAECNYCGFSAYDIPTISATVARRTTFEVISSRTNCLNLHTNLHPKETHILPGMLRGIKYYGPLIRNEKFSVATINSDFVAQIQIEIYEANL